MHILVIDDESIIRETMASILDLEGHRVTLAADGERGIELFTSCRYDLVFDRSRHARPVRVGSRRGSEATPGGRSGHRGHRIDGVLAKPFDMKTLLHLVQRVTT